MAVGRASSFVPSLHTVNQPPPEHTCGTPDTRSNPSSVYANRSLYNRVSFSLQTAIE